jgi:hypothetical protein
MKNNTFFEKLLYISKIFLFYNMQRKRQKNRASIKPALHLFCQDIH